MNAIPGKWRGLSDRTDRATAKLARIATCDTILGGARALVLAKRLDRMPHSRIDGLTVVSDIYSASTGRASPQHDAWACGECGQVFLGQERADTCCSQEEI